MARPERFELEPFCGRERSRGPRHARFSRGGVGSGSPQAKSRAERGISRSLLLRERWRALRDSNLSRFAGVSEAGVPDTRGFRVAGWEAGARRRNPDPAERERDLRSERLPSLLSDAQYGRKSYQILTDVPGCFLV